MNMNIQQTRSGGNLFLSIEGVIDTKTAPTLEKTIQERIEDIRELVFDLEKVNYISTAGLRVLLYAHQEMMDRGDMRIVHANQDLMEIFHITGFSNVLNIE